MRPLWTHRDKYRYREGGEKEGRKEEGIFNRNLKVSKQDKECYNRLEMSTSMSRSRNFRALCFGDWTSHPLADQALLKGTISIFHILTRDSSALLRGEEVSGS